MDYIFIIVGAFLGGLVGGFIYRLLVPGPTSGTLRIDHTNPEKDIYRFDIADLDALSTKTRIILKVDNNADLSQK